MEEPIAFVVSLNLPQEQAIERTTSALKAEGFGVLSRIDVGMLLKERLNADFRPYAILGACNPGLAQRALNHDPDAGLVMPCNVTVEESGGRSVVRIGDPEALMKVGGLARDPVVQSLAREAREKLQRVADALCP